MSKFRNLIAELWREAASVRALHMQKPLLITWTTTMTIDQHPVKFDPNRLVPISREELAEFQRVAAGQKYVTTQNEEGQFLNEATQRAFGMWRMAVCWTVERMQALEKELAPPGCAQREDKPEENAADPALPVAQQDERSMFEAWLLAVHGLTSEWQQDRNCYKDFPAHLAFKAWRAALSSKRQDVQGQKDVCAEMRALCSACGGTGDVHSIDGEWRGACDCEASVWSRAPSVPTGGSIDTPEPINSIPATMCHDEGAIARCNYCGRYSLDPKTLSSRSPTCDCGKNYGWSGSFVKPNANSIWSGRSPAATEDKGDQQ